VGRSRLAWARRLEVSICLRALSMGGVARMITNGRPVTSHYTIRPLVGTRLARRGNLHGMLCTSSTLDSKPNSSSTRRRPLTVGAQTNANFLSSRPGKARTTHLGHHPTAKTRTNSWSILDTRQHKHPCYPSCRSLLPSNQGCSPP
jgi:hypothetical protein